MAGFMGIHFEIFVNKHHLLVFLSAVYLTFANKNLLDYYLRDLLNVVEAISSFFKS